MTIPLPAGVNRRCAFIAAAVLAFIWIWVALDRPYSFPTHIVWDVYTNSPEQLAPITDAFDFPPVDSHAIKLICEDTKWNEELVFECNESVGGIGNIRNSILSCVRYAISAGGAMVIPRIVVRDSSDISRIRTGEHIDMDYMFDTQHFVDSLRLSCPPLRLYASSSEIPERTQQAQDTLSLVPETLVDKVPGTGLAKPEEWRDTFYTWLEQFKTPETKGPMVVALGRSYLQYPIYSDGEEFALSFGGILKLRADARRLATATLTKLAEVHEFQFNLSAPILQNSFFGAHLRTEKDAVEAWPAPDWIYSRYETQSKAYLEQAQHSNTSLIYVSSGDASEVARFAVDAQAVGMRVTTKLELLAGDERSELEALAWDQQALVDFLVMMKASDFAGIGHSSFAWNVALKRHQYAAQRDHLDGPQMLSDELSQIYGAPRAYPEYAACLWP